MAWVTTRGVVKPCLQLSGWSAFLCGHYSASSPPPKEKTHPKQPATPTHPSILPSNCLACPWGLACNINEPFQGIQCFLCPSRSRWGGGAGAGAIEGAELVPLSPKPNVPKTREPAARRSAGSPRGASPALPGTRADGSRRSRAVEGLYFGVEIPRRGRRRRRRWDRRRRMAAPGGTRWQLGHMMAVSARFSTPLPPPLSRAPAQASRRFQECRGRGCSLEGGRVARPPRLSSERVESPTVAARGGAGRLPGDLGRETRLRSRSLEEEEEEEDRWDWHVRSGGCRSSA